MNMFYGLHFNVYIVDKKDVDVDFCQVLTTTKWNVLCKWLQISVLLAVANVQRVEYKGSK